MRIHHDPLKGTGDLKESSAKKAHDPLKRTGEENLIGEDLFVIQILCFRSWLGILLVKNDGLRLWDVKGSAMGLWWFVMVDGCWLIA
mgnify:CR=1 FL=1